MEATAVCASVNRTIREKRTMLKPVLLDGAAVPCVWLWNRLLLVSDNLRLWFIAIC